MGRRGVLALAAALVTVVVGIGVGGGGLPRPAPSDPADATTPTPPEREPRQVFVLSVDVTPSGVVWLTTAGTDCDGCVVVWRRADEEDWTPLRQVGSDLRAGQIRMGESGGDGLIGGAGLWVTHDGGDSWTAERGVPVASHEYVQVEVAGAHVWALVRSRTGSARLWRSMLGASDWREASLPAPLEPEAPPVAVGAALVVWGVGPGGDAEPLATYDGGRTWQPLDPPCARRGGTVGTTAAYVTCLSRRGLEAAVAREGGVWDLWPLIGALGPTQRLSPQAAASSFAAGRDGTGYAVVRGGLLVTHDRGLTWTPVE